MEMFRLPDDNGVLCGAQVASLLTPCEDDDELSSLHCRQSRAYSVGSRPDASAASVASAAAGASRRKMAAAAPAAAAAAASASATASAAAGVKEAPASSSSAGGGEASRVRAYSVGSRKTPTQVGASPGPLSANSSLNSSRLDMNAALLHLPQAPASSAVSTALSPAPGVR